jgi:sulfopyruvate decarboxylase subunit beta
VKRTDCLRAIYDELAERAVVTIMGAVAVELYSLGHRPNFFYLEHAMGLAPSVGLGVALAQPDREVVVIDGDGSVLMNLGGLTTLARYAPPNLTHIVFDNESLLSVGGFPTATSTGSDLAAIAAGAGIDGARAVDTLEGFEKAAREDLSAERLTCLVAKVDAVGPASFHMDLHLLENRFEFARAMRVPFSEPSPETPPRPEPRSPEPESDEPTMAEPPQSAPLPTEDAPEGGS